MAGLNREHLMLSRDRKVSPYGTWNEWRGRGRWLPVIQNSFGLPSGITCPGKTEFCVSCYAVRSEQSAGVRPGLERNLELLVEADTVDGMAGLLREMLGRFVHQVERYDVYPTFRIHWDGDFFSPDYARAWAQVIAERPGVDFWAYTRSFVEPVNVVPILAPLPNLALYLSVDEHNLGAARRALIGYQHRVHVAACAVDYATARRIASSARNQLDRPAPVVCPENAGRMQLMENGVGACITCEVCVEGRRDVLFSTSHREVAVGPPTRRTA